MNNRLKVQEFVLYPDGFWETYFLNYTYFGYSWFLTTFPILRSTELENLVVSKSCTKVNLPSQPLGQLV